MHGNLQEDMHSSSTDWLTIQFSCTNLVFTRYDTSMAVFASEYIAATWKRYAMTRCATGSLKLFSFYELLALGACHLGHHSIKSLTIMPLKTNSYGPILIEVYTRKNICEEWSKKGNFSCLRLIQRLQEFLWDPLNYTAYSAFGNFWVSPGTTATTAPVAPTGISGIPLELQQLRCLRCVQIYLGDPRDYSNYSACGAYGVYRLGHLPLAPTPTPTPNPSPSPNTPLKGTFQSYLARGAVPPCFDGYWTQLHTNIIQMWFHWIK